MKLYLFLSLLFLSITSAMGMNDGKPLDPSRSYRISARRFLFLEPRQTPLIQTSSNNVPFMLPAPAFQSTSSVSSSSTTSNKQISDLELELDTKAKELKDFISLIDRGLPFAQVVQRVCKLGDSELLKAVLDYDKQAPIEIQETAPQTAIQRLFAVRAWHDNPAAVVYDKIEDDQQRMKMLKILCVDPRSQLDCLIRKAAFDKKMNVFKLSLFIAHGNNNNNYGDMFSYRSQRRRMLMDSNDMRALSTHYSQDELKEYRQLLIDREGITPEHLVKAAKGRHEYMVKRILYLADNNFWDRLNQKRDDQESLLQQAFNAAQENNDKPIYNLLVNRMNARAHMTEQEHQEFYTLELEKNVQGQNIQKFLADRQIGLPFAQHQKALRALHVKKIPNSSGQNLSLQPTKTRNFSSVDSDDTPDEQVYKKHRKNQ